MYEYLLFISISILVISMVYLYYSKIVNILNKYVFYEKNITELKKRMSTLDNSIPK